MTGEAAGLRGGKDKRIIKSRSLVQQGVEVVRKRNVQHVAQRRALRALSGICWKPLIMNRESSSLPRLPDVLLLLLMMMMVLVKQVLSCSICFLP